jgi:hypothetical protein
MAAGAHRLRVQMPPDQYLGVAEARREYANAHLAPAGGRQAGIDNFQCLGITEAADLNNSIALLDHGRSPCNAAAQERAACRQAGEIELIQIKRESRAVWNSPRTK